MSEIIKWKQVMQKVMCVLFASCLIACQVSNPTTEPSPTRVSQPAETTDELNRRMFTCYNGSGIADRPYPRAIIRAHVSDTYADANNILIDSIKSKCTAENYGQRFFFCVNAAHRNKNGFISDVRTFHGYYDEGKVLNLTSGSSAAAKCKRL
jgi:hypothetical protein